MRPEQGLLGLRKGLGVYANLRPVWTVPALMRSSALRPEVLDGVDLVVIRELTGGIYFGQPSERRTTARGREAVDTCAYTEAEIARLVRAGFALARQRRKKITSVDKANVMTTSRLWREVATEIAREHPDVAFENVLVDAMAMHLLRRPREPLVGRGDHPHIHRHRLFAAHPLDHTCFQDPQQLALEGQSQSSNLIQKQGSTVRRFDMTGAGFMCIRERALFVAKQLRLDQAFRKSSTVYADKGLVASRAGGDDGLRHQLFPGSTLSANQYIDVALGHATDRVINQPHGITAADQLAK